MTNSNALELFVADFHRARLQSFRNSQTITGDRWKAYLDELNARTLEVLFADSKLMGLIAITASAISCLFYR